MDRFDQTALTLTTAYVDRLSASEIAALRATIAAALRTAVMGERLMIRQRTMDDQARVASIYRNNRFRLAVLDDILYDHPLPASSQS